MRHTPLCSPGRLTIRSLYSWSSRVRRSSREARTAFAREDAVEVAVKRHGVFRVRVAVTLLCRCRGELAQRARRFVRGGWPVESIALALAADHALSVLAHPRAHRIA